MEPCVCCEVALAALYLRGLPRPLEPRRSLWPGVDAALRAAAPGLGVLPRALRRAGFEAEALVLEAPGVLARGEEEVAAGRVLTAGGPEFPRRWLDVLGRAAPPALWVRGCVPPGPYVAVVGSRRTGAAARMFARAVAAEAARLGCSVVSGGAAGCDRAAAEGAGERILEIVPCGFRGRRARSVGGELSVCAPDEPFSAGTAMERNALVYAAAELAVIAHARLKEGGTWHGAADAVRRRLAPLAVRRVKGDAAARALAGLGATPMDGPGELEGLLQRGISPTLFG